MIVPEVGLCEVCHKNPARHPVRIETMFRVIEIFVCDECYYTKSNAELLMNYDCGNITLEMIHKER